MDRAQLWALQGAIIAGALGIGVLFGINFRKKPRTKHTTSVKPQYGHVSLNCSVCSKPLQFSAKDLIRLSPAEHALVVRCVPGLVGRPLAEYICPHCEAAHCFVLDTSHPQWVGANLYEPQTTTTRCMECRKTLQTPPWSPGQYDGALHDAPELRPDYGLICSRCGVVVCVSCCINATRNRTNDGSYLCPRCSRGPVDKFLHF